MITIIFIALPLLVLYRVWNKLRVDNLRYDAENHLLTVKSVMLEIQRNNDEYSNSGEFQTVLKTIPRVINDLKHLSVLYVIVASESPVDDETLEDRAVMQQYFDAHPEIYSIHKEIVRIVKTFVIKKTNTLKFAAICYGVWSKLSITKRISLRVENSVSSYESMLISR